MVLTRARSAALRDEMRRLRRASMLLTRGAAGLVGRRSSRLAGRRFGAVCGDRLARFNRKIAKYTFCQLIGDITPLDCLEKMLRLARGDADIIAADPLLRANLHGSVRVMRLIDPSAVGRVNRRWRSVKRAVRRNAAFSY